ncbi:aldehyde dehydrogenase family protein [bacterium]|nr:aldehyde dehydrogenase family protein [bacterium]
MSKNLDIDLIMDRAVNAAREFRKYEQDRTDLIVKAAYRAGFDNRISLAQLACDETGLGIWQDKVIKNVIATQYVYTHIKDFKTAGVISVDESAGMVEIAEPLGPIFAVTPITNPTSTVLFKILITLKTRNPIIIRPHGAARKCSIEAARLCYEAALGAGAPENCIQWIHRSSQQETLDLMAHPKTALVLATGSLGLVKAAYSSGNPAIGVGPGNVPVYIGKSADVPFAVEQIILSKTFDNGTVCASEQAIITRTCRAEEVVAEFKKRGAYFLSKDETEQLEKIAYNKTLGVMNVEVIGKPAHVIAKAADIEVPPETSVLIAKLDKVGLESPLSLEILAPILAFYVVEEFEEAIHLCREINKHGGLGHTVSIFSRDEEKIKFFAREMNAGRVVVNTPSSQGAMGGLYNTLSPSLTLGCGPGGKNISADNISAKHLFTTKRIARRKLNECLENMPLKRYLDGSVNAQNIEKLCK